MNRLVLDDPPALNSTDLANSNIKCADASDGWLGTEGYWRLPLYLESLALEIGVCVEEAWGTGCGV